MNAAQIAVQFGVPFGVPAILLALVGGFFGFRMNQANYAKVINEISVGIAKDLREDNRGLSDKLDRLELHVDRLEDLIRAAIPAMDSAGYGAQAAEMRAVLKRGV